MNQEHPHDKIHVMGQAVSIQKAKKPDKGKLKPFCKGDIIFTEDGCIYIKDPALVEAIQNAIGIHGGICIQADDPSRPQKEMNVVC